MVYVFMYDYVISVWSDAFFMCFYCFFGLGQGVNVCDCVYIFNFGV